MKNKTLHFAKVAVTSIAFFGFVAFAAASTWTAPTGTAPASDVAAPVNISSTAQTKAGELDVTNFYNWGTEFISGLTAIGAVWPGTTSTTPELYIKSPTAGVNAAIFGAGVGIRGSLGVTQNDGTTVTPATGGTFNTIYVQGQAVCLQNGADCPTGSGSGSSTVSHDTTLTGTGTTASPLSINIIHDSTLTGAGTVASPLSVAGSGSGGLTGIAHDASLQGTGTTANPLSVVGSSKLYEVDSTSCNAVSMQNSSTASDPTGYTGVEYFGSYTFPLRSVTSYKYCYISGSFVANTYMGYTFVSSY